MSTPDPSEEIARLRQQLEDERRLTQQWREVAEERRVTLETLRQRRVVRWLFAVAKVVLPIARRVLARRAAWSGWGGRRIVGDRPAAPGRRPCARGRAARAVSRLPTPSLTREVGVVVLTRDGREHLERCCPALDRRADVEVVVVDNASGPDTADWLQAQPDTVLRNDANASFSAACNQGAAVLDTSTLLFLNDDVEPLDDHWLDRMLAELRDDVAVGAQLVYPRRGLMDGRVRDVAVQHLGIGAVPDGWGPPRS